AGWGRRRRPAPARPSCRLQSFHSSRVQTARSSAQPDVDITPPPVLPRLGGAHHGMTGGVEVFARVSAWAGVTAPDEAACQTNAQVRQCSLTKLDASLAFARRVGILPSQAGGPPACGGWFGLGAGLRIGGEMFACIGDRRGAGVALA